MFGAVCFWIFSRFTIFNYFTTKPVRIAVFLNDFLRAQLTVDLCYSLVGNFHRTAAFQLFKDNYKWEHPIRSLGIRAADLVLDDIPVQLDLFGNQEKKEKLEKLDRTVDEIRRRFGYFSIQRAAMYQDKVLSHLDAGTHTIHPHSYFHG